MRFVKVKVFKSKIKRTFEGLMDEEYVSVLDYRRKKESSRWNCSVIRLSENIWDLCERHGLIYFIVSRDSGVKR